MARGARKKAAFGTSMGVSSIIAILVILMLVVFSSLSITTSKADLTLSEKSSNGVKAYYEADSTAVDMMADVSTAFKGGGAWTASLSKDSYTFSNSAEGTLVSYSVPIDENRKLNVELLADKDGNLKCDLWQVVPAKEWVPDESLNLHNP